MDKKLKELRQKLGAAIDELEGLIGTDKFAAKETEIRAIEEQIAQAERALEMSARTARPVAATEPGQRSNSEVTVVLDPYFEASVQGGRQVRRVAPFEHYVRRARTLLRESGVEITQPDHAPFRSFGEQLIAVANAALSHGMRADARLVRAPTEMVRAPTGAAEIDPSAGGFLVQTDFSTAIFMRAYEMGEILSRVEKLSLSTGSNSIKIPGIDETSRVTGSRWGGVQSYWLGSGMQPAPSKPKFRLVELDLKKLISLMYTTDELMADAPVLTSIAGKAFSEELMFMTEDAIFEGTGSGQPLGIKNAACKVSVAKETGQAAKTIVYENALKMWSRCWARSRQNGIWTINQDCEPQLYAMSQVIGTAGVPVYLPANGISGIPTARCSVSRSSRSNTTIRSVPRATSLWSTTRNMCSPTRAAFRAPRPCTSRSSPTRWSSDSPTGSMASRSGMRRSPRSRDRTRFRRLSPWRAANPGQPSTPRAQ